MGAFRLSRDGQPIRPPTTTRPLAAGEACGCGAGSRKAWAPVPVDLGPASKMAATCTPCALSPAHRHLQQPQPRHRVARRRANAKERRRHRARRRDVGQGRGIGGGGCVAACPGTMAACSPQWYNCSHRTWRRFCIYCTYRMRGMQAVEIFFTDMAFL